MMPLMEQERLVRRERIRLAYLEALGIDSYVSRTPLPAAAPARRPRAVRPAAPEPAATRPPDGYAEGRESPVSPGAGPNAEAPSGKRYSGPAPIPAPVAEDVPVFAVAATKLGGWYWLDEVPPGRALGPDYLQLIQAICIALEWPTGDPVHERFAWPMGGGGQLDQGVASARAALAGFLRGRIERLQPAGIVLLGEFSDPWFNREILAPYRVVRTVSAWQMLRRPELKRRAWAELRNLRGDGA